MKLSEAIEVLKKWGSLYDGTSELLEWDMGVFNKAIDTVVTHCEQKTYTDKDMEEFAEWLIGRSADWITDEERCETAETFIEMWENERGEK